MFFSTITVNEETQVRQTVHQHGDPDVFGCLEFWQAGGRATIHLHSLAEIERVRSVLGVMASELAAAEGHMAPFLAEPKGLEGDIARTERDNARLVAALVAVRDAKRHAESVYWPAPPHNNALRATMVLADDLATPLEAVGDLLPAVDADHDPDNHGADLVLADNARDARHEPEFYR